MTIKKRSMVEEIEDESIRAILRQPVGAPIDLTRDQVIAIVSAGIGGRPDLPTGEEYVRRVREIWRGLAARG